LSPCARHLRVITPSPHLSWKLGSSKIFLGKASAVTRGRGETGEINVIAWSLFLLSFTASLFIGIWIGLRSWQYKAFLLSNEELDVVCRALEAYRKLHGSRVGLVEDVYNSFLRARG